MLESISYCLMHLLIIVLTLYNLDIMFLECNVILLSLKNMCRNIRIVRGGQ